MYPCDPVQPAASVACTVKVKVPAVVGVPVSAPPVASVNPGGSVPVTRVNEYGPVPPEAVNVWLYAVPTAPEGIVVGLTVMLWQLITRV